MGDGERENVKLVQFQAVERGDYFCIYALNQSGCLWERAILLLSEDRPEMATWKRLPGPKP